MSKYSSLFIHTTGLYGMDDVPEKRLMIAVLIDAYRAIYLGAIEKKNNSFRKRRRKALAAKFWLTNDEDWGLFSFVNICKELGVNKEKARSLDVMACYPEISKMAQNFSAAALSGAALNKNQDEKFFSTGYEIERLKRASNRGLSKAGMVGGRHKGRKKLRN